MTQTPTIQSEIIIDLPVSVRYAKREDLPHLEWNAEMWGYRDLFQHAYEESLTGRRLLLLADIGGYPVGRLFVQLCPGNFQYADGFTRAYLYSFHVMPFLQGKGIGSLLIRAAEAEVIGRGFHMATIAVAVENVRALRLYERHGYQIFHKDHSDWSYRDPAGHSHNVSEVCWALKKRLTDSQFSEFA
jgi:ribosomal protein S18 acetylase RimI-like enzyme